ncbi:hypothetical protein TGME49_320750 [Toxoplasma gondii ME49]|uniref:GDP dissociation inhibitor n=4 Tax=Toxoplasma gondii TaxID=5811 RepID=S7UJZ4_TOXGG|nr:hypothetical protein TGME49_320750 [Toxoplasma gondii ME49]EPR58075.1 hypothetical protein TGGT1_320750 [Toxoplasma gondii GT1]EPT31615.1 hypothetical protein TGME49_320750 [Toxoplasma gondii ME49]KAF4644830.1 hypothetical protein TGRH88_006430 [Toxoplasma gondii]KYF39294.1 GDP dissociation inhibitor [Toxoplasma gondii ARI]|eukprot:XP_002369931.2 hypothetical protein TGME49_320750 [Toxoplasma gondii ME49]
MMESPVVPSPVASSPAVRASSVSCSSSYASPDSPSPAPLASDVLVVGTGLSACLCAAALARRGARVVQVEESANYGGAYQSLRLHELIDWASAGEAERTNEDSMEGPGVELQTPEQPLLVLEENTEENAVCLSCRVAAERLKEDPPRPKGELNVGACRTAPQRECLTTNYIDKRATEPFLSPAQFQPRGAPGGGFGNFFSRQISFFPFAKDLKLSPGARAPCLASGSDIRGVRTPPAPPRSSSGHGANVGDRAIPGSTEADGDRDAWRRRIRNELLKPSTSNGFNVDLLPRILYSSSPVVNILVESGAARYLEFRPLEAPVYVADLELDKENFAQETQDGERTDATRGGDGDAAAGGRTEKRTRPSCTEHRSFSVEPREVTGRQDGSECHEVKRRKTGTSGLDGTSRLSSQKSSSTKQVCAPLSGRAGTQQGEHDRPPHLTLEAVPLSRGSIFGSSLLTLREKRTLMKFVSRVATQFLSPQFLSAAHCWGRKESAAKKNDREAASLSGSHSKDIARGVPAGSGLQIEAGGSEGEQNRNFEDEGSPLHWEAFLRQHDLTDRLQRYVTFGVCLSECPFLGTPAAEKSPSVVSSSTQSVSALSGGKPYMTGSSLPHIGEVNSLGNSLVWTASEGERRLELFVQSVGAYSRQTASDGAWLYPLFGTSDLPQAFARVASLSEAICMLRAGIQEIKLLLRTDDSVTEARATQPSEASPRGLGNTELTAREEGGTEKQRNQRKRSLSQNVAAFGYDFCEVAREKGKVLEVKLTNGETVRTRLILFESESLPPLDTPVWNSSYLRKNEAGRGNTSSSSDDVCSSDQKGSPSCLSQTLFGTNPQEEGADTEKCVSTGGVRDLHREAHDTRERSGETGGVDEHRHPCANEKPRLEGTDSLYLFSCHLIAVCRKPVLNGKGFRMCVCTVRASSSNSEDGHEVQEISKVREHSEADDSQNVRSETDAKTVNFQRSPFSTARWPVHILQTDASCATAPRDYTVLHLVHLGCRSLGPCECCPTIVGSSERPSRHEKVTRSEQKEAKDVTAGGQSPGGPRVATLCREKEKTSRDESEGRMTRTQENISCKILREVLRSLLARAQDGNPEDDCLLSCSFVFCPALERPCEDAFANRSSKRFEGFLRGFREGPLIPADTLERLKKMGSCHREKGEKDKALGSEALPEQSDPAVACAETEPVTEETDGGSDEEKVREKASNHNGVNGVSALNSSPIERAKHSGVNEEDPAGGQSSGTLSAVSLALRNEDGRKETSASQVVTGDAKAENDEATQLSTTEMLVEASGVKGCGFVLLPSAPVTPFFSLLSEPLVCRDILSSLLSCKDTLNVDEMVPKHIMQGLEEVEEFQRVINAPYEQLDKLGISVTPEAEDELPVN